MPTALRFSLDRHDLAGVQHLVVLGHREALTSEIVAEILPDGLSTTVWRRMVGSKPVTEDGRVSTTWLDGTPERLVAAMLPEVASRHNAPSGSWAVAPLLAAHRRAPHLGVVVAPMPAAHHAAIAAALGRAFPTWADGSDAVVPVVWLDGPDAPTLARLAVVADAVRRAAEWVDRPPSILGPNALREEAEAIARRHSTVRAHSVVGPELARQGLGGIWAVGKAAVEPPAMVVLDHLPEGEPDDAPTEVWVGKGILFDTGGLSLKTKTAMPGMKTDMGGAAAVLAAFEAAVRLGHRRRLTAIVALAENAIGPGATRPDDVVVLASGRSVEINNTDAEGRLVLADAMAWALKHRRVARILDLATLTGAQAVATGRRIAAVVSNDGPLEDTLVTAGRRCGDVVFPLPFVPEFLMREFKSPIADMRNSVSDRNNAQSSCAAAFLHAHLDGTTPWAHVDLAAPAVAGDRGTGFGVALLLALADAV